MGATCVRVDGPYLDIDSQGQEVRRWGVAVCDARGEVVNKTYTFKARRPAVALGRKIARDKRLKLVDKSRRA